MNAGPVVEVVSHAAEVGEVGPVVEVVPHAAEVGPVVEVDSIVKVPLLIYVKVSFYSFLFFNK